MLSGKCQTEKDKYYMISLIHEKYERSKLIGTQNRLVVPETKSSAGWVKWVNGRWSEYKPSYKISSHSNLMYSMISVIILYFMFESC